MRRYTAAIAIVVASLLIGAAASATTPVKERLYVQGSKCGTTTAMKAGSVTVSRSGSKITASFRAHLTTTNDLYSLNVWSMPSCVRISVSRTGKSASNILERTVRFGGIPTTDTQFFFSVFDQNALRYTLTHTLTLNP